MATWGKRDLYQRGVVAGIPHQGFGRAMKVGREEVVGLITALQRFVAGSDEADTARWNAQLDDIEQGLGSLPHVTLTRAASNGGVIPLLRITIDEARTGKSAYDVLNELLEGTPSIALAEIMRIRAR